MTLDVGELNAWMDRTFRRSAFRLETLEAYEVASDGSDFRRYLDGEPSWSPQRKQPWLDHLASERDRGLWRHRVRIVTRPVGDYMRYACEWGYEPNVAAGEDVRILDLGERPLPAIGEPTHWWKHDWWLTEDDHGAHHALRMLYDSGGQFVGAQPVDTGFVERYVHARAVLWEAAEPFSSWWGRHGELRRDHVAG